MRVLRRRRSLFGAALELFFFVVDFAAGCGASAGADASELDFFFFSLSLSLVFLFLFFAAGPGRRGRVVRSGVQEALSSAQ